MVHIFDGDCVCDGVCLCCGAAVRVGVGVDVSVGVGVGVSGSVSIGVSHYPVYQREPWTGSTFSFPEEHGKRRCQVRCQYCESSGNVTNGSLPCHKLPILSMVPSDPDA